MSKTTKTWLVIATFLVLAGCILFGGVMTVFNWDFMKLQTITYETNNYDINEVYKNISIVTDTADIVFVPSGDASHSVVCYEQKKVNHSVSVTNDTLVIEIVDTRKWYDYLGIAFSTPTITVCIPQGDYGSLSLRSSTGDIEIPAEFRFECMDISGSTGTVTVNATASDAVKIKAGTGDIRVENTSVGSLDLSVSTGNITVSTVRCQGDATISVSTGKTTLTDTTCKNLMSTGNTGNIALSAVIAAERFSIKRSTGDVRFDRVDAAEIFVETDTGDVVGSVVTDKVFIAHSSTGRVHVPKTITGGRCEINTDTGNIKLEIQ